MGKRIESDRVSRARAHTMCAVLLFLAVLWGGGAWARVLSDAPPSFADLVKEATPSVVNISAVKIVKGQGGLPLPFRGPSDDPMRDFFERFFGDRVPKEFKQRGLGSGFIIDKEGYILTNNHVVEKTDEIKVKLHDETEYDAQIVGRDPKTDLALIRIRADRPLKPLRFGDSDSLRVGDWVVAIGNPFGLGNTATAGIVSAKYRHIGAGPYDNFIQTDAPINPGNSGGPLLNTDGEVIGINTAIFSRSGGSIGIGFAIPSNMARDLLPQLKKGKVVRGWLGVMIQKITPELKEKLGLRTERGALVADVTRGGPAEKAGIRRGDVITAFDGKRIREMNELPYLVASTPANKKVTVTVLRKGKKKEIRVKIGVMPEEPGTTVAGGGSAPDLGLTVEELTPELASRLRIEDARGLVITRVRPGSPAAEGGLRQGDVILELDQAPVGNAHDFERKIRRYKQGSTLLFVVKRRGATLYLTVKLKE